MGLLDCQLDTLCIGDSTYIVPYLDGGHPTVCLETGRVQKNWSGTYVIAEAHNPPVVKALAHCWECSCEFCVDVLTDTGNGRLMCEDCIEERRREAEECYNEEEE